MGGWCLPIRIDDAQASLRSGHCMGCHVRPQRSGVGLCLHGKQTSEPLQRRNGCERPNCRRTLNRRKCQLSDQEAAACQEITRMTGSDRHLTATPERFAKVEEPTLKVVSFWFHSLPKPDGHTALTTARAWLGPTDYQSHRRASLLAPSHSVDAPGPTARRYCTFESFDLAQSVGHNYKH